MCLLSPNSDRPRLGIGGSGPAHSLIDAHHLQHEDNDDDRADQVHDCAHVTSLPSEWLAALCVLMVPRGSGRVVFRLPGSCGVPSSGLIPAVPHTHVLHGVCKARSSPRAEGLTISQSS
jgi:hypothetical protein